MKSKFPDWNITDGPSQQELDITIRSLGSRSNKNRTHKFVTEDGCIHDVKIIFCTGGSDDGTVDLDVEGHACGMIYNPLTKTGIFFRDT